MSIEIEDVVRNGKVIGYYGVNSIVGAPSDNRIYSTRDDVPRSGEHRYHECKCGGHHEDAFICFQGRYYPGKICLSCNVIIDPANAYSFDDPDYLQQMNTRCLTCDGPVTARCMDFCHNLEYPCKGHPLGINLAIG